MSTSTLNAMTVVREDLNPCTVVLNVTCTPEQVKSGFDRAIKDFTKQLKLPGFRPGQAPKAMVEQVVDPNELYRVAADFIVTSAVRNALKEQSIEPHDTPVVDLKKLDREAGACDFVAKIPLKPIVEIGPYTGLQVERPSSDVTDEDVEAYIAELQRRAGQKQDITDRGADENDHAVINLRREGDEGEGRNYVVVVGQTFSDLDEALKGMRVEEMKVTDLAFPSTYHDADWAGQTAKVRLTLKSVSRMQLPQVDDDFAKNLKAENLEHLKNEVREQLGRMKMNMAEEYVTERLQEELLKGSKVLVPDTMWESVANQRLRELDAEAREKGQTIEDYAKANGMSVEQMVEAWQREAKVQVQRAVLAREIFMKEGMRLTNQDLNESLFAMAQEYRVEPKVLFEALQKAKNFQELEIRGVFRKVLQHLRQNAVVTALELPTGDAPAPAAKASAKTDKPEKADKTEKAEKAEKPKKKSAKSTEA